MPERTASSKKVLANIDIGLVVSNTALGKSSIGPGCAQKRRTNVLTNAFGGPIHHSAYIVVCGRDASIKGDFERHRFDFRKTKVSIEGAPVIILTYDDMTAAMERALDTIKSFALRDV